MRAEEWCWNNSVRAGATGDNNEVIPSKVVYDKLTCPIEHKQKIQNFLNCCIMETHGDNLTHDDLAKLLEFYFNDEMYCEGLSCYQKEENT
ncbi:hypothetical protein VPLG_00107 [Vibrio phage eugene 12A10]|uniref:hypothetical protein n=1 Tax=Vibrio phage eugene 12A10 TaxID=573172 RepID=UPI000351B9C3|nr:hypothetical protein VPLG_00107 [Vibrio phage eugene 12A10]AGN51546.1 hypothetical protein VPLG_00107 [Vibrio phage eugene 12A10]